MLRLILCAAVWIAVALPLGVRAQVSQDSLEASQQPLFTAEDALFAGGVIFATIAIAPLDKRLLGHHKVWQVRSINWRIRASRAQPIGR